MCPPVARCRVVRVLGVALVSVFVVFGAVPSALRAQEKPKRSTPRPISGASHDASPSDQITLSTDLVQLDVSVVDGANRSVFDIPRERFAVTEDGAPQKIEFFSKEQAPVSLALVIDTSGSMRSKLDTVIQAAENLSRAKRADDEVAVIGFKQEAELIQEFTHDEGDVDDALENLVAGGSTSLLDAIEVASDYVQTEGHNRRRALVVVSDGVERDSYYGLDQVVEHLRPLDVRLYLVGFTEDLNASSGIFKKSQKAKAEQLVHRLAEETGGRAFLPNDVSELGAITEQIAEDLRTIFVLGYYPTNAAKDGTFRKVSVRVLTPDGKPDAKISARTRAGYVAAKP